MTRFGDSIGSYSRHNEARITESRGDRILWINLMNSLRSYMEVYIWRRYSASVGKDRWVRIEDPSGPTEMNMQWSMMQASPILKDMHIHDTFNHQDGKLGSCSYYYYSTIQELISSLEQDHFIWNMALEMPDGMMNNHTRFFISGRRICKSIFDVLKKIQWPPYWDLLPHFIL